MKPKTEIAHITTPKAHYTLDFGSGTLQVKPIMTNADRVRAMTDEELAAWLADHPVVSEYDENNPQHKAWLDWLKQEAHE